MPRITPPRLSPRLFALLCLGVLAAGGWAIEYHRRLGMAVPEWPLLVDLFVVLPLAYLLLVRPTVKQAGLGLLALGSLGVLFGSIVLPAEDKVVWLWLEQLRWVAVAALVAWQAVAIGGIVWFLVRAPAQQNRELCLHAELERRFGAGAVTELLKLEGRMWLYALSRNAGRLQFPGVGFFTFKQGGNASNQAGFLLLMAFELPVVHVLLHLYSPLLAMIVSAATLYGLLFLYAEYRATRLRPISLTEESIHLRCGVVVDTVLLRAAVVEARVVSVRPPRAPHRLRLVGMGKATVWLRLQNGTRLKTVFGEREVAELYIGVDEPHRFVGALQRRDA